MTTTTVRVLLIALGLTFAAPRVARAWGDLGHQAVAEIAERRLDASGRALVYGIIAADPLAYAAIFPDVVRSDDRYKEYQTGFADYHLIEIPFGTSAAEVTPEKRKKKDALVIIEQARAVLLQKPDLPAGISDAERTRRIDELRNRKILELRYLVHVVGDVHQPLHVGNGTDLGANMCYVKWVDPTPVSDPNDPSHKEFHPVEDANLHTVWDERMIDYLRHDFGKKADPAAPKKKRHFGYQELVGIVLESHAAGGDQAKADLETASRQPPVEWLAEAQALHSQIYPDAQPARSPSDRHYCKGAKATDLPVLDEAYARRSLHIIETQILKGGARLAVVLNRIGADAIQAGLVDANLAVADKPLLEKAKIENERGEPWKARRVWPQKPKAPPPPPPEPPMAVFSEE